MKYLKTYKIYEELDFDTYKSASSGLIEKGYDDRAQVIFLHGMERKIDEIKKSEDIIVVNAVLEYDSTQRYYDIDVIIKVTEVEMIHDELYGNILEITTEFYPNNIEDLELIFNDSKQYGFKVDLPMNEFYLRIYLNDYGYGSDFAYTDATFEIKSYEKDKLYDFIFKKYVKNNVNIDTYKGITVNANIGIDDLFDFNTLY